MSDITLIPKAVHVAAVKYSSQRRTDADASPCIHQPLTHARVLAAQRIVTGAVFKIG